MLWLACGIFFVSASLQRDKLIISKFNNSQKNSTKAKESHSVPGSLEISSSTACTWCCRHILLSESESCLLGSFMQIRTAEAGYTQPLIFLASLRQKTSIVRETMMVISWFLALVWSYSFRNLWWPNSTSDPSWWYSCVASCELIKLLKSPSV